MFSEFQPMGTYGHVHNGALLGPQGGVLGMPGMEGFAPTSARNSTAAHDRRIREAARLYADCLTGKEDPFFMRQAIRPTSDVFVSYLRERYPGMYPQGSMALRETMATSDYQALYVDVIDRIYYGFFQDFPVAGLPMVRRHTLRDTRLVSRYLLDGMVTPMVAIDFAAPPQQTAMSGPVPQDGATFPTTNTAPLQYAPLLYQAMGSINWSAFLNDDLGIFKDVPRRLAMQGNRAIDKFITKFFVDVNGPNALLYKAAFRNLVTTTYGAASNNPPLGSQGLMDAMKVLALQQDSSGQPINVNGKMIVWYTPFNRMAAKVLQNQLTTSVSVEGGSQNAQGFPTQWIQVNNFLVQGLQWVELPYAPLIATGASGSIAKTQWGIVIDPNDVDRPAVEFGQLASFETPQMFQKVPNTMRMGGGVDPMMGDFNSMNSDMKVVTAMGGAIIDGRTTVASTGAGS